MSGALSLRFAGSFVHKGGSGTVEGVEVTLDIDYIQSSALLGIATPGEGLSVGVMAGPWGAYRLACDIAAAGQGISLGAVCDNADFSDFDIKTLDYGVAFGGGVEVPLAGGLRLGVDALYSLGLAEVDDDGTKTRHFALQTGFVLPVG